MKTIKVYGLLVSLFLLLGGGVLAQGVDPEAAAQTPLKFFQAVNAKDYTQAWGLLTETSKARLAAVTAEDFKVSADNARQLLDAMDPRVVAEFWDPFRQSAKPELYVTLSYKYNGAKDGAHVVQVSGPAEAGGQTMDMIVKDEGGYKFGLVETYQI